MKPKVRRHRYPTTGHVGADGFPAFLARHLGPSRANLRLLAHDLAGLLGAPHVTLTNSGSSANLAAALALRERCGGRRHAVASGLTFPTTLSSLLLAGFEVTLADVEEGGFGLDPASARAALRPDTGLVCLTHFLGFPAQVDALAALARERDLLVLADGCETLDLRVGGSPAHERATLTTWSFYHPHHLSSYGGGAVAAHDTDWHRLVESVVHWGRACSCHDEGLACPVPEGPAHAFTYVRPGLNAEMSELNACFGRFQLGTWREQEAARVRRYALLAEALDGLDGIVTWPAPEGSGSPFAFPIALPGRDAAPVAAHLLAREVEVRTLMGGAAADQQAFAHLPHDGLARARALSASAFFVGVHQTLPEEDVLDVARILAEELPA